MFIREDLIHTSGISEALTAVSVNFYRLFLCATIHHLAQLLNFLTTEKKIVKIDQFKF